MDVRRTAAGGVVLFLLAAGPVAARDQAAKPVSAPRPALAVIIAVDGLSWQRLSFYRPWFVGGLKRLLDEGQVETGCRYRHINTETGPGHASLGTGTPPRVHGIIANRWFQASADGKTQRAIFCVDDPTSPGASTTMPGPGHLRVPTLGDRLVEAYPQSRVVAVAGKDRASIFLAGRDRRHTVYWYDSDTGVFKTSAAYDPPTVSKNLVAELNRSSAGGTLPGRFGLTWRPLPLMGDAGGPSPRPTAVPGIRLWDFQIPANGIGWDHSLTMKARGYFAALTTTPFLDTLVADLAVAFIESDTLGLGKGETPDLLALSFSAQDLVSHSYGTESEENLDVLRRLDLELGRVLDALERRVPRARLLLAFSSDHGFPLIPEAEKARDSKFQGGRLVVGDRAMTSYTDRLNRYLSEELCLAPGSQPLAGSEGWNVFYNRTALPMPSIGARCGDAGRAVGAPDLDRVLPASVARLFAEEIESVWLVSERERWPKSNEAYEYVTNDFDAERSGDAVLVPRRGVMTHWDPARGAMHGTHFDYDTHVPLIFWGGGVAKREVATDSTPYDLAPTLAALLAVDLPAFGRSRLPVAARAVYR
jgi:predicted AlkP superfamily pyrophosphatase or phosphodiesterase